MPDNDPMEREAYMSKLLWVIALVVLVMVVIGLLATFVVGRERVLSVLFGPVIQTAIDFRTLQRPARPNQYLVCPPGFCQAIADAESPVYPLPVAALRERWLAMIAQQPRVQQVAVDADQWQYDFLQHSRLLRFPDTITVRFIPLSATQSTLAIYSRSHYGYDDLGVNRRRVTTWLAAL
jgi:uncharacterized protein (DUF1499 family)